MDASRLNWLSATDAARAIRDGLIGAEQLTASCLARVREADGQGQAWTFLDPGHAPAPGRPRGAPTPGIPPADRPVVRPPPSPPAWCRLRSAARPTVR